ncbi:ribosome maturation protein [Penicillium daleae]|uniref:Ribosome maturation protein n=1 Tax=Penicillium daleae TaxID=63821 RepID=A0AAD6C6Y3_9EURO|nr:ribosome maturation protein [Penicillium daleae]KAJ5453735.1 ribosome maturation protein [Penicillium daleae]
MTRGNTMQSKAYYKGRTEDFVIFVEDITAVQNWRKDHTLPLAQVMDGWKIFTSHQTLEAHARLSANGILQPCRHGPQGIHNEASRDTLEREFGTSNDQEVIFHILEKGEIQECVVSTNLSFISPLFIFITDTDINTQYLALEVES